MYNGTSTLFPEPKVTFTPRPYQTDAISAGINFLTGNQRYNAFMVLPTGAGKSVVIANMLKDLTESCIVLQPSKEILEQNVAKYQSYGFTAGVYSASAGAKFMGKVTFATIGSVIKKIHLFRNVKYIIIDECHLVNSTEDSSMYTTFIKSLPNAKVLGLTATPYRLSSTFEGSMLTFLNRSEPRIFDEMIYYVQNSTLFDAGHLAKLEYYSFKMIDRTKLQTNAKGSDFTEASLKSYYRSENVPAKIVHYSNRLLAKRKNLLVFCSLIEEAKTVTKGIPGAVMLTGDTDDALRTKILSDFKAGKIKCLVNVGVLTTGFDYPELECVLLAKSTMSLSLYYQIFGRGFRTHKNKQSCWLVDLGGNIEQFGKFETMTIAKNDRGYWAVFNNGKQLTNVIFNKLAA